MTLCIAKPIEFSRCKGRKIQLNFDCGEISSDAGAILLNKADKLINLNFNPHLHAIVSDGCFSKDGDFHMAPGFMLEDLEEIFQYEVLKMLKKEGKITNAVIENMLSWRHSGFHVYIGDKISSND